MSAWNGPPRPNLRSHNRINGRPHVCKVGRTKSFHHSREPGGIWVGPSIVGVETKSDSRHLGRATGAENAEGIDPIEHPSSQSHGLKKKRAGVAARGELGGHFGQRPLIDEGQRPRILDIDNVLEFLDPRDGSAMDIIAHDGPILQEVAEGEENMLRQIGDRDDQKRSGAIGNPGVVRLHKGRLLRHA